MFLDEKPFIYVWRPLYETVLVPHVYPVLERAGLTIRAAGAPASVPPKHAPATVHSDGASRDWDRLETLILSLLARQDHHEAAEVRREIDRLREQNRLLEERVINVENLLGALDTRSRELHRDITSQWEHTEKLVMAALSQPVHASCCEDRSV